jgi:hypothetical protein
MASLRALLPQHGAISETLVCDAALHSTIGELSKAVRSSPPGDRLAWVKRGVYYLLIKASCMLEDDTSRTVPELCKYLAEPGGNACTELVSVVMTHLESHNECPPVAFLLEVLCELPQFVKAAKAVSVVSRLRDVHFRSLLTLFGSKSITCLGKLRGVAKTVTD